MNLEHCTVYLLGPKVCFPDSDSNCHELNEDLCDKQRQSANIHHSYCENENDPTTGVKSITIGWQTTLSKAAI